MWADMAFSGAQSLISQGFGFIAAGKVAKQQKKWQAYNNAMTRLANANNQNAITTNEILAEERAQVQRVNIQRSAYITSGAAEAAAAAADTGGRSVNAVIFDIGRNASMQQAALEADLEAQYLSFDNQRANSQFQMASNLDYSYIPKPQLASYALNFGSDMANAYKRYTGPTERT
jgi:hypothetical protein